MKVSVLILSYNFEHYIQQTVESALHQTEPADEVIVIDDCSTDNSVEVLKQFGNKIKIISTPVNSGVLESELYGMSQCTGDVICVLGGDDIWLPGKIAAVKKEFENDAELMLVTHDFTYIDKHGQDIRKDELTLEPLKKCKAASTPAELDKAIRQSVLSWGGMVFFGNMSIRKKFLDFEDFRNRIDKLENKKLTYDDTTLTTYLTLYSTGRFGYINQVLYKYRIHDTNISMSFKDPERMKVVLERGYWSHKTTLDWVKEAKVDAAVIKQQQTLLLEKTYLLHLYNNRRFSALSLYLKLIPYFCRQKKFKKETVRFVSIFIMGARFFTKIKR